MMTHKYVKKKCVVCGREFECYLKVHHGGLNRGMKSRRMFKSKTCSPKCSRDWAYNRRGK